MMTWTKLGFGTAVLASLTLGSAIFYDMASRNQVRTEDVVELLEATAERRLPLQTSVSSNVVAWSNAVWTIDESADYDDGTGGRSNYLQFSHWNVCTNRFVTTGQWFRAWEPITSQVGRICEPLYTAYTVTGFLQGTTTSHLYDGVYTFHGRTTNAIGVSQYVWVHSVSNAVKLSNLPQHALYAWKLSGAIVELNTIRARLLGGSMHPDSWQGSTTLRHSVQCNPSGSLLTQFSEISTNGSGTNQTIITNSVAVAPMEYPARDLTNVANAVTLYDRRALLSYVDSSISFLQFITNYVDLSRESNGTFDAWFASTNSTLLPKLTLERAFELLGPTVGTNVVVDGQLTGRWLDYPARGTNEAIYGSNVVTVTKEALAARFHVLALMTATQRPASWGSGTQLTRSVYAEPVFPYGNTSGSVSGDWGDSNTVMSGLTAQFGPLTNAWYLPNASTSTISGQAPLTQSGAQLWWSESPGVTMWIQADWWDQWIVHGSNYNTGVGVTLDAQADRTWSWYQSAGGIGARTISETVKEAPLVVSGFLYPPAAVEFYARRTTTNSFFLVTNALAVTSNAASSAALSAGAPDRWDGLELIVGYTNRPSVDDVMEYGWVHRWFDEDVIAQDWSWNGVPPGDMYWTPADPDYLGVIYGWRGNLFKHYCWSNSSVGVTGQTFNLYSGPALMRWSFQHCVE